MPREAATFRWPDRASVGAFLRYGTLLCVLWIAVYGGASRLTGLHDYRVQLTTAADAMIPFIPEMSVVYLSLFPMLWLSPFVLHNAGQIKLFAKTLAWLFVLSGVGFILLPSNPNFSTPDVRGPILPIFEFADWVNLDYNYLPSLHVGMAVVCAYAYTQNWGSLSTVACFFWAWASVIVLSTLLTHQHYVIDVVAGLLLGVLVASQKFTTNSR